MKYRGAAEVPRTTTLILTVRQMLPHHDLFINIFFQWKWKLCHLAWLCDLSRTGFNVGCSAAPGSPIFNGNLISLDFKQHLASFSNISHKRREWASKAKKLAARKTNKLIGV